MKEIQDELNEDTDQWDCELENAVQKFKQSRQYQLDNWSKELLIKARELKDRQNNENNSL